MIDARFLAISAEKRGGVLHQKPISLLAAGLQMVVDGFGSVLRLPPAKAAIDVEIGGAGGFQRRRDKRNRAPFSFRRVAFGIVSYQTFGCRMIKTTGHRSLSMAIWNKTLLGVFLNPFIT